MPAANEQQPEVKVVRTLRQHRQPLSLSFLAERLDQTVPATRLVVERLKEAKIIEIRDGGNVELLMK